MRMIPTRGRRVVIGGFGLRRAVGQGRITMVRNGGRVTQGYVLLAQGCVSREERGQFLLVGFLLIFQHLFQR